MKKILLLLITLFLLGCVNSTKEQGETMMAEPDKQEYFIGDNLDVQGVHIEYQTTTNIALPTISFKEGNYTLTLSKADAVEQLRLLASQLDSSEYADLIKAVKVSINYLKSNDDVNFENIWSMEDKEGILEGETGKYDERTITINMLREQVCELIDSGKFQLVEAGKKQKHYFFRRVDSNYGGNVKGVFSKNGQLIWICPPFEIE